MTTTEELHGIADIEDAGPREEDYCLTPTGYLGSRIAVSVVDGKFLGDYADQEHALKFVRDRMRAENFWPDVWNISDHGNASLVL